MWTQGVGKGWINNVYEQTAVYMPMNTNGLQVSEKH